MAKFCTECGKEIPPGVAFCTECGTKAPADPITETVPEVKETKAAPPAAPAPPVQSNPTQQTYSQPQASCEPSAPDPANKVVSTGTYFGLMFLFSLPIIGLIACIIMAFVPKNKNLKNYARAMLIWTVIALVVAGLLFALFSVLAGSVMSYFEQFTQGGDSGGLFNQFNEFNEFENTMSDLGNITQQFESGGLSGLPLE